jgi:hypothetical protein
VISNSVGGIRNTATLEGIKDAIRQSPQQKNAQSIRVVAASHSEAMIFDLLTSYPKQWFFGQKWLLAIIELPKNDRKPSSRA